MIAVAAWCYAKVLRHQLENAATRCARESREGGLTVEQADAILEPLRRAIAETVKAEGAQPEPQDRGPDVQIVGAVPGEPEPQTPAPESLGDAWAMFGMYGAVSSPQQGG